MGIESPALFLAFGVPLHLVFPSPVGRPPVTCPCQRAAILCSSTSKSSAQLFACSNENAFELKSVGTARRLDWFRRAPPAFQWQEERRAMRELGGRTPQAELCEFQERAKMTLQQNGRVGKLWEEHRTRVSLPRKNPAEYNQPQGSTCQFEPQVKPTEIFRPPPLARGVYK